MGIKVDPSLVDFERMKKSGRKVEVEAFFINWPNVAQLAKSEGLTLEEVLGIKPVPKIQKPPGLEKDFNEVLEREAKMTGKTAQEFLEEARKSPIAYRAAEERAKRLGVDVSQLRVVDYITIAYSSFPDYEAD